MFQKVEVSYDDTKKEVTIWDKKIKKWFPMSMKWIDSIDRTITYTNSGLENYYFYTTKKTNKEVISFYRTMWEINWWKELIEQLPEWMELPELPEGEEIEENYLRFEILDEESQIPLRTIVVNTNEFIPKNLLDLGLEWLFVEVRFEN